MLANFSNPIDLEREQIKEYTRMLNQESIKTEYVWASSVLYYNLDKEKKERFLDEIDDIAIREIFKSFGPRSSLLEFSLFLDSETLLLAYLLNQPNDESRQLAFSKFYEDNLRENSLIDLNRSVVSESRILFEDYSFSDEAFAAFLLNHYYNAVRVVGRSYFESLLQSIDSLQSDSKLLDELLIATRLNSSYLLDDFKVVSSVYDSFINIRYFPLSYDLRDLFWGLDYVMYQTGYIDKSLEIQRTFTIPISEYLDDKTTLNELYSIHGGYLSLLGKYSEALAVFKEALKSSEGLSDQNLAKLYNNLSLVYFKTGESGKYVETQLKALEHAETNNNLDYQIQIYRNLHVFYRKNQNPALALSYFDQAADLAESTSNTEELIDLYISKAVFERDNNNNNGESLALLNKAESLIVDDSFKRASIRILSEKADILYSQGDYEQSMALQNEIVDIGRAQSDPSIFLEALIEVAELEIKKSNYGNANRLLTQFKNHDVSIVDFSVLTQAQIIEAKIAHENGDFASAEKRFKETTDLVLERARYSADYETGYWTVEDEYLQLFESYADFLIERRKFSEAVQLLDRVKTINDASMLQNPLITSSKLSEEQLARDRQITREMENLRRRAFTATGEDKLALNSRIELLQARKRELHKQGQRIESINQANPIWSVQRTLKSDQLLLHITSIDDNYYFSEVSSASVSVEKVHLTDDRQTLFENAIESMVTGRTDLQLLYQVGKLIGVDRYASDVNSIILMADGYLHQLPLDVLPIEEPESSFSYGSARYLIEKVDTRHLNHLGELFVKSAPQKEFRYDFSGFGVADFQNEQTGRDLITLPRAPDEIKSISENLTRFSRKEAFTDHEATPESFRMTAGNSRILHMATHTEISEDDPLFTRIPLLPENGPDDPTNQIFAYELFDLNLSNELIMLNSCESGGDRTIQGSGIMGISRALHYAGAQSLILNAWSVNDQFAADFANAFYTHINNGETKSRALQLAKIDFIKESNANPHFWGPYILNGNNKPLIQKPGAKVGNWVVALIFITGFLLVSRTRKKTTF